MNQTLREYIEHPSGKGNSSMAQKILKDSLVSRYERISSKIEMTPYKLENGYLLHFLIPSETDRENTYDVVLKVNGENRSRHIRDWEFKLFSNSPGFYYTFAYAYNAYDMFIDELKKKLPKECFTKPPYIRNPHEIIGYEKSIFFAVYHIMEEAKLSSINWLESNAIHYDKYSFFNTIRDHNKIQYEIKLYGKKAKEKKEKEKADVLTGRKKITQKEFKPLKMTAGTVGIIDGVYTPKKEKIAGSTSTIKDKKKRGVRIIGKR